MKKLLFFSVTLGLLVGMNAQTRISQTDAVSVQKQSIEKLDKEVQSRFAPSKDVGILDSYNYNASTNNGQKATYRTFKWVSTAAYALRQLNLDKAPTSMDINLFPDSLAFQFNYAVKGDPDSNAKYSRMADMRAASGFVFDPYSKEFDLLEKAGLSDPEKGSFTSIDGVVGYGYRLDSIGFWVWYWVPPGHDFSTLHDSLYFHITYINPYIKAVDTTDYTITHVIRTSKGQQKRYAHLSPTIRLQSPSTHGNVGFSFKTANEKKTIGYELLAEDTPLPANANPTTSWYTSYVVIPVEGGFSVPPGGCLSVAFEYKPAFTYNDGDTLMSVYFDITKEKDQYDGREIKKPTINIASMGSTDRNGNEVNTLAYCDGGGYNSSLAMTMPLRYNSYKLADFWWDTNAIYYNAFVGYYYSPLFDLHLSLSSDSLAIRPVGITDYSKTLITNIYPNPATTQLTIDLNEAGYANVVIYNILGQAVLEETLNEMSNKVNIATLSAGIYTVKVTQNGRTHTVKVAKE